MAEAVALPVAEALREAVASPVADAVALDMAESVATPVSVAMPVAVAVPVAVSGCSCIVGVPVQVLWEEDSRILPQRPTRTAHKNTVLQLLR